MATGDAGKPPAENNADVAEISEQEFASAWRTHSGWLKAALMVRAMFMATACPSSNGPFRLTRRTLSNGPSSRSRKSAERPIATPTNRSQPTPSAIKRLTSA